ncbi:MAG: hypothetical protein AB7Q29_06260 [Vicinamibacterales bacterium]
MSAGRSTRIVWRFGAGVVLLLMAVACGSRAAPDARDTFDGTTIRIIVAYPPGGGNDLLARVVANHLGRFLPGTPSVVVENMPGAGGLLAATYLASAVPADGLSIGLLGETSAPNLIDSGLLDRVALLGSPAASIPVVAFSTRSGIASVEDWRRAAVPPRLATTGGRSLSFIVARLVVTALGLPAQIVSGYAGLAEMRLALQNGEVDAYTFDAGTASNRSPDSTEVLRFGAPPEAGPFGTDALLFTADAWQQRLLKTGVYDMRPFTRVFAVPRRTPPARLALLRDALQRVWPDESFLREAHSAGLTIAPIGPDDLEAAAARLAAGTDDALRDALRVE